MGKRSNFKRRPQDAYDTPPEAVKPLLAHLSCDPLVYWEPCAGSGSLIEALADSGRMTQYWAADVKPRGEGIEEYDALDQFWDADHEIEYIITNPPWTRQILHPMIEHFSDMRPTWLLFDADWSHTKQAQPYWWRLRKVVSVGRVSWMQNGVSGKDNCAWYLFDAKGQGDCRLFGRAA